MRILQILFYVFTMAYFVAMIWYIIADQVYQSRISNPKYENISTRAAFITE